LADRPIVAIGDVHGRLDLLRALHRHLETEVLPETRTAGVPLVAHLGDYIDRGPDSLGCLLAAHAFAPEGCETLLLPGNHEQMALDALDGREGIDLWLTNGGTSALAGMDPDEFAEAAQAPLNRLRAAPAARLEGRWLLSHAGVPRRTAPADVPALSWRGTPVREDDHPLWVRDAFLGRGQPYPCGTAVLHGHTIARDVEVRSWRVGIDLGAYRSGRLCAAEIRGVHIRFHLASASRG
jgi:serine/threonine protein phosphatase 1